jgi:hypothetical protein
MGVGTGEINSVEEFIEEELEIASAQFDFSLYRGQAKDWPLLPKIARGASNLHEAKSELPRIERRILTSFRRRAVQLLDGAPDSKLGWMTVGQHHGLATRLLDWTENPLAGLWFAVRNARVHEDAVVWRMAMTRYEDEPPVLQDRTDDLSEFDPLEIDDAWIYKPSHVADRAAAQESWFTLHPYRQEGFVPLKKKGRFAGSEPAIDKYIIPSDETRHIKWKLSQIGVHDMALFSDLDSLSNHLNWIYKETNTWEDFLS